MANLDTAVERAHKVRGMEAAARHYADVDTELGLGNYTEDQAAKGEESLRVLSDRFPGVRERSHEKVENGAHVPNLSKSANRNLDQPEPKRNQKPPAHHPVRQRHTGAGRRASGRSRYARAFDQTGIPAAKEGISQLTLRTLGGLVGLSFLYLLLSPRGVRAVQLGSNGVTYSLRALISPHVDPLRATNAARSQSSAGTPGPGAIPSLDASITAAASAADRLAQTAAARVTNLPNARPGQKLNTSKLPTTPGAPVPASPLGGFRP